MTKLYDVEIKFLEPMLGTVPKDPEVYAKYIQSKAPKKEDAEDELESVGEIEEKGWTGFHMEDGEPFIFNYVVKGFFKDACSMLRRVPDTESKKITAYKKIVDGLLFVYPRKIFFDLNGGKIGIIERPLRAQTAKGERVTVTRSDFCPPGTEMKFRLEILGGISEKALNEWLEYGNKRGFGQWRNAGYGSCNYSLIKA